jgi:hypothetical protein
MTELAHWCLLFMSCLLTACAGYAVAKVANEGKRETTGAP